MKIHEDVKSFCVGLVMIVTFPIWFPLSFLLLVLAGITVLGEACRDKWKEMH